ncbi:MAG: HAMP domain-containing histidine kinase [bacterium]|nr:HAMP domain-containing histidine kinase [bacterium]
MNKKDNLKDKSQNSIFQKELETVKRIQAIQNQPELSPGKWGEEYRFLSRMYQKLLREMKKITRIGDVNYKKLLDANDQIGKQKNELEILNSQLMEAKATQDKLYSIIAHDLRNPLQFLLFSTEALYIDYENMDEESIRSYIGKVFKTVQNTSDLLENLLQWSMSQYGKLECRPRPIDLGFLVYNLMNFFRESAEKKKIDVRCQVPEKTTVFADEDMINSVLRNLVSNALKFTAPGGRVTLASRETGNLIIMSVSDSGVGIPEEKLETLFKIGLSSSTTGTAEEKGTGLGLILCKELVEKNKGTIQVTSQMTEGSCFEFSLPKAKV